METFKLENVNIRHVTRSDIDPILNLGQWLITYREMLLTDPGGPLDLSFVAEIDNRIIGCILAHVSYVGIPFTEICTIHGIIVEYDFRGQGIGERMVNELVKHCRSEGIKTVRVCADESSEELKRLAEHLGFKPSRVINYDMLLE